MEWYGVQDFIKSMGEEGCLFLSLIQAAEKETGKEFDIVKEALYCLKCGWIREDFYCNDSEKILSYLLKRHVLRSIYTPEKWDVQGENGKWGIIIEKWFNWKTGFTHFRLHMGKTLCLIARQ